MNPPTLSIGRHRFVLVLEREYKQLQKQAARNIVRPEFGEDAMIELRKYRKLRKATDWKTVKRGLGL